MRKFKKLTAKEKILIIMTIIISIFAFIYQVYAWNQFMTKRSGYAGGAFDQEDWPNYLGAFDVGFSTHINYGTPNYSGDGLIKSVGGKTDGTEPHDNGSTAVGTDGSDGNTGYAGSWNGTANFNRNTKIVSGGEAFRPHSETVTVDGKDYTMDNIIWLKDLCENKGVLCSARGMPLTGSQNFIPDLYADGVFEHDVSYVNPSKKVSYNYKEITEDVESVASGDIRESTYKKLWRTPCEYAAGESSNCIGDNDKNGPARAFLISEFENITGGGEKTPLQIAWWNLLGYYEGTNTLYNSALEFQNYINDVKIDDSASKRRTSIGDIETGFNINYDPKFIETDVTTVFDSKTNQWIIGPFKINYVQYNDFAYIYNLDIFANEPEILIDKSEYKIAIAEDGNKDNLKTLENGRFPDKNTEFYIILNYNENIQELSNIKVDFQYQNARGEYTYYDGTYSEVSVQGEIYGEYNQKVYDDIEETYEWIVEMMGSQYAVYDPINDGYWSFDYDAVLKSWTTKLEQSLSKSITSRDQMFCYPWVYKNKTYDDLISTNKCYGALTQPEFLDGSLDKILLDNGSIRKIVSSNEWCKIYRQRVKSADEALTERNKYDENTTDYEEADKKYKDKKKLCQDALDQLNATEDNIDYIEARIKELKNACENAGYDCNYYGGGDMQYSSSQYHSVPRPLQIVIWKDYIYTAQKGLTAQRQAIVGRGARWWETKEIRWKDNTSREAQIKITKTIDPANQAKDGDTFNFILRVNNNGTITEEPLKITYKEGQTEYSVTSQPYKWEVNKLERKVNETDEEFEKRRQDEEEKRRPTYEVIEDTNTLPEGYDPNGVTITNGTGTLENGKTAEVKVENKLIPHTGTLKITKKFEDTKLDDNQFLRQQIYTFKVKITGKCQFEYGGKYNLDKDGSQEIIAQIDLSKGNTWTLNNVIWYRDNEPSYTVEEINTSPLKDANGCEYEYTVKIENNEGYFKDNETVNVDVTNIQETESASIKIIKEFEGKEKFSEEELERLTFRFLVNVYNDENCIKENQLKDASGNGYTEKEVIATIKRALEKDENGNIILDSNNEPKGYWVWEGTTDEYVWLSGNYPWYTVKEDETWCPMHKDDCPYGDSCSYKNAIKFDEVNTKGVQADGSIKGRFVPGDKTEIKITVPNNVVLGCEPLPINVLNKPTEGKITINKTVSQELYNLLKDEKIDIVLKVSGNFGFDENGDGTISEDEWHYNKAIQIANKANSEGKICKELDNKEDYDNKTFITFTKNDFQNLTATWSSSKFEWYGEAPQVEILEDLNGKTVTSEEGIVKEIHASGIPNGWKLLTDAEKSENDIYNYNVTIKNDISDDEVGYIKIIKTLEKPEEFKDSEGKYLGDSKIYTPDYINSLRFKFKIDIAGQIEYVTLGDENHPVIYDEENNQYRWEYTSGKYAWEKGTNAPTYSVEEVTSELASNVSLVSENNPITGTLKPTVKNDTKEVAEIDTTDCEFINKVNTQSKKLHIDKKFTDNNLVNSDLKIEYKVTISGKFLYGNTPYDNDCTINVSVNKDTGWQWKSENITWCGEAPTYTIEEIENDNTKLISSQNATGSLNTKKEPQNVIQNIGFVNGPTDREGYLSVTKTVSSEKGGISDPNQEFTFKVTIKDSVQYIKLKAGETWTSNIIRWKTGENAPKYKVEEVDVPYGYTLNNIKNQEGSLADENLDDGNNTVNVVATNDIIQHTAKFKVAKKVIFNKLIDSAKDQKFEIYIKICGTFKIDGKEPVTDGIAEIILNQKSGDLRMLGDEEAYISPNITWWGDNAPTVIVKEVQKPGWSTPLYSNNGDTGMVLQDNSDSLNTIVITNRIQIEMDLTMKLGGIVWNDIGLDPSGKNTKDSVENGKYDSNEEQGIKGVQVNVYRVINDKSGKEVLREKAISYEDAFTSMTEQPIITAEDGSWEMTGLRVPAFSEEEKTKYFSPQQIANRDFSSCSVKYDVEFIYDGQTYEPTTLLEFFDDTDNENKKNTREEDYLSNPSKTDKEKKKSYYNDSLAIDFNRVEVNNRIQEIYGKNPISGDGTTIGVVSGDEGEKTVIYKADVSPQNKVDSTNENSITRIQSVLQTRDPESNVAYDLYKTIARTSSAGIEFPVSNAYQLEYTGTKYNLNGTTQYYRALYPESLHINLGLKNRKTVDIDASKDLQSAKVVVDGKEIDYTFNSLADILSTYGDNSISKSSSTDNMGITYELGLYKTDYYYRAEIYRTNADVYDNVQTYYKKLSNKSLTAEDSEIEVFLTYRINLYNTSKTFDYKVKINQVDDYFDSSFGKPINTQIMRIVNDEYKEVANGSYLTKQKNNSKDEDVIGTVEWKVTETNIKGSDGKTYNKMTANFDEKLDTTISSGENRYIYVTFAIQKDTVDEVKDCIALGNKSNIVEISNYSTYYSENSDYYKQYGDYIAGKIDKDSAPGNVNIVNHNEETMWFEDDTDAAPVLNITLQEDNREVTGIAWEDKALDGTSLGNGIRDNDEALIGGLTTELIEKIKLPDVNDDGTIKGTYKEYDFLWPTNKRLDCFGGKTLKSLTGFDSTTETSRQKDDNNGIEVGQYTFTGIPVGTYAVRFLYGNNKMDLDDTEGVDLKPAEALDKNGNMFSSRKTTQPDSKETEILTANYDGNWRGSTPAVYNGQDYKSTIYQVGFQQTDNNGYLINRDHDLTSLDLMKANVSDARDSEYKRLDVIAKSETITNVNSSILDTATELSADHNDLYKDYSMFADTAKLDLNIEAKDVEGLAGVNSEVVKGEALSNGSVRVEKETTNYTIAGIDFGLIERPETKVVLDKEIKEIKLTTNDNKVIFDAVYNIGYVAMPENQINDDKVVIGKIDATNCLVADIQLDEVNSKGIDVLQAISKNEKKPEGEEHTGTQNFRFINVDNEILQGTTIELTYQISALNVSEQDYMGNKLKEATDVTVSTENGDPSIDIKTNILSLAKEAKDHSSSCNSNYGEYLGTTYYTGTNYNDKDLIVTSKVRQIIDYVDNDGVFTPEYNSESEHMWKNTSITELTGAGYEINRLISKDTIPGYEILDKNNVSYITGQKNNLVLSVDDQNDYNVNVDVKSNKDFEKELMPYNSIAKVDGESDEAFNERLNKSYSSNIILTVTKTVSAQDDADNLTYDNLTEIVKFENTVGRRDVTTIAGNANPRLGEFTTALKERDSSATELITFTPPTGIEVEESMTTQILVIVMLSLGVVVIGIVVIKKKILK